jgi:hypothetical protein
VDLKFQATLFNETKRFPAAGAKTTQWIIRYPASWGQSWPQRHSEKTGLALSKKFMQLIHSYVPDEMARWM